MKLDQIDEAVRLRNYRRNVMKLADIAATEPLDLTFLGESYPGNYISLHCVRQAVIAECNKDRANYEAQLIALGVEIPNSESA